MLLLVSVQNKAKPAFSPLSLNKQPKTCSRIKIFAFQIPGMVWAAQWKQIQIY